MQDGTNSSDISSMSSDEKSDDDSDWSSRNRNKNSGRLYISFNSLCIIFSQTSIFFFFEHDSVVYTARFDLEVSCTHVMTF